MKLTKIAQPSPNHAECYKCFGTGFFCLGIENGKPYSNTGFTCYPCNGAGWVLSKKAAPAPVQAAPPPVLALPFKSKADMKRQMQGLLDASDRMVMAAVVRIFDLQTADEQASLSTSASNGVGFGAFDAEFMSSIALQIKEGRTLTVKQLTLARKKIRKYWKQLGELAQQKHNATTEA